jgi:hypothetical protein
MCYMRRNKVDSKDEVQAANSGWKVTLKMENGRDFSWAGDADDNKHAEGLAIAEAVSKTGEQVYAVVLVTSPKP